MAKKKSKDPYNQYRVRFPEEEKNRPWLSILLDGYAITDFGVHTSIKKMEEKGNTLACAKGCSHCCATHKSIPVYPLEVEGLKWYVVEKVEGQMREKLKETLWNHKKSDPCGFLIQGVCSVHPLRPMACRQFNVFNRPCGEGEDAYYARREDVLTPIQKYPDLAFVKMMPYYGAKTRKEAVEAVEKGLHHRLVKDMLAINWMALAMMMDSHEMKISGR